MSAVRGEAYKRKEWRKAETARKGECGFWRRAEDSKLGKEGDG
jgi:hypothetical protein